MTEDNDREHDVWSGPDNGDFVVLPPPGTVSSGPSGGVPITRPGHPDHPDAPTGFITQHHDVPRPGSRPFARRDGVSLGEFGVGAAAQPRQMRLGWFLGAAGVLVGIGLIVVLVMAISGSVGGGKLPFATGGADSSQGPPLAQACPPPTGTGAPGYHEGPPVPAGPRTVDKTAGISYKQYGSPWGPWGQDWTAGQLKVHYRTGQGFVTETYGGGHQYWASILSGSVPATVNDGDILDLKCVGQQIVADVRGAGKNSGYYPQPNTMEKIQDKLTTVGGLPAYVSIFRVHFGNSPDVKQEGLKATSELVGVVTFDVGKKTAAVLYVSVPSTHKQYDYVIKDVIASVRAAN